MLPIGETKVSRENTLTIPYCQNTIEKKPNNKQQKRSTRFLLHKYSISRGML